MVKKTLILVVLICYCLIFTSCGLDYRYSLDEKLHNQIECVYEEDEAFYPSYIVYNGEKYIYVGTLKSFPVSTYEVDDNYYLSYNDTLLGWNGNRYFWYIDEYYSDTADNPIFIYNDRLYLVFFHENYNYLTDVFVIRNTNEEIQFKNILTSKCEYFDFSNPISIEISSKQYPRIKANIKLECINNQWYLSFPDSKEVWIPSDEFIRLLFENNLI